MKHVGFFIRALPFLLGAFCAPAAFAQADIREAVAGYAPQYFADSSPPTAYEMVQLLPGFRLQEGNTEVRGYSGALGNVLIDGRPPASKQDTLEILLKRIPAASILRIELIRPGAAGIDMQGYSQMANVVRQVSTAPSGRVELESYYIPLYGAAAPKLAGEISLGSEQILDLSGSLYRTYSDTMGGTSARDRFAANGTVVLLSQAWAKSFEDGWTVSSTYRQPLWGGKLRLNGLYKDVRGFNHTLELKTFPTYESAPGETREFSAASEFGSQYSRGLWEGGEGELIAIRRANGKYATQTVVAPSGTDTSFMRTNTSETIARGALRQHSDALSLEAGVESAINTLNNALTIFTGGAAALPLPGANVRISEWRSEFSGIATWKTTEDLTLEAGLRYEMSTLKQQSAALLRKDLFFLKPHAMASWKPTPADELRVIYERRAGQLDFDNFIPRVNITNNMITVGNADLEPDTLWHSALSWEHRFDKGSVVLTARRQMISNVVDRVPVYTPTGVFDGVGNIGNGRRDEYQADFLLPLDFVQLTGMTLQGTALRRFSQVVDPTTGQRRIISDDKPIEAKITLTDDIPKLSLRWGLIFTHGTMRENYKFNEFKLDKNHETFDIFVEHKPSPEWLLRLNAKNITNAHKYHGRSIYAGPRNTAPFRYLEERPALVGARVGINIQRMF